MRILLADDDPVFAFGVQDALASWGHQPVAVADGAAAWQVLAADDPPELALLDWMMPGMDGLEVCRRVRASPNAGAVYVILLTARAGQEAVVAGLEGGADEYLTKPIEFPELRARIDVGLRIAVLQRKLACRIRELEEALARVKQLQGLLPICSYCKRVRDDQNYWRQVEEYVSAHSEAQFSHSICPGCMETVVEPELRRLRADLGDG